MTKLIKSLLKKISVFLNCSASLKILSVFILLFFLFPMSLNAEENEIQKLRAGTFVKVISREEINTLTADAEDVVSFINLQSMYVYETNAIPENTIFYGEVEDVREPVEGRDAAIKIWVNKMITPDKKVYKIKAHLYSEYDNYIGGNKTASMYYHKIYNHSKGFRPMLQVVPLNVYEVGQHTVIKPGTEFFIVIEEDIILK